MWREPDHLKHFTLRSDVRIKDALQALDATGSGIVLLMAEDGVLEGIVTDGDIRRAMLRGATLEDQCSSYMNAAFTFGRSDASRNENLSLMSRHILHLPILDADKRLVDLISWKDFWHVNLVSPSLSGNELKYVEECIVSGWVSSQGSYVQRFEESIASYLGIEHALSTANCTLALQLAIQALDIGLDDEVIVPNFTFGASASAVIQRGGRPVFVDVDAETWTLDPAKVEAAITCRTKAIMPVHIYGHPCDMPTIMAIARRHGLRVIEDCAEALGAEVGGRKVGTFGDVGCFSFFANKVVTTGEGGMLVTNDAALAGRLRLVRDHGMSPERRYWHLEAGTNARLTNLQAAVGVAQMERVEHFLAWRDGLARRYDEELAGIPGIAPHRSANWARKVCWLYSITVDPGQFGIDRDTLVTRLKEQGVETRPVFAPLDIQPAYRGATTASFAVSHRLGMTGLSLPTGNETPLIETARVGDAIRRLAATSGHVARPLARAGRRP
jgi:perosamine synthetase